MNRRIPITVLSGYLGAGKTTIVNSVLAQPHGLRLAVLVNDFGPVNIDAGLIRAESETVIELSNGCVCCSIGDDLGAALEAVAAWQVPPDRVVLEASGVADPARIAMTAGHWPGFELDAVIVAADAATVQARWDDKFVGRLVQSQLRRADIIALTKTDLLAAPAVETVRTWLRGTEPAARVVPAPNGWLPAEIVFGHLATAPARWSPAPDHHAHFATAVWRPGGPVDTGRLRDLLDRLPETVHRAKGSLADGTSGAGLLVQCVGRRCTLTPAPRPEAPGLVLISTGSEGELAEICAALDRCRIAPVPHPG